MIQLLYIFLQVHTWQQLLAHMDQLPSCSGKFAPLRALKGVSEIYRWCNSIVRPAEGRVLRDERSEREITQQRDVKKWEIGRRRKAYREWLKVIYYSNVWSFTDPSLPWPSVSRSPCISALYLVSSVCLFVWQLGGLPPCRTCQSLSQTSLCPAGTHTLTHTDTHTPTHTHTHTHDRKKEIDSSKRLLWVDLQKKKKNDAGIQWNRLIFSH